MTAVHPTTMVAYLRKSFTPNSLGNASRGRSLIELLIAMVIALIALGAIVTALTNTSLTGEQQDAQASLNEEAALLSSLLSAHFRMAGSSTPIYVNVNGNAPSRNLEGWAFRGCENGLSNPTAVFSFTTNAPPNACVGGAANTAPDAITVLYEATVNNTIPTAANQPTDCLGQAIAANQLSDSGNGGLYSLAENRFFVQNNSLWCAGSGNYQNRQEIMGNVLDMQVTYGLANVIDDGTQFVPLFETIAYLRADEVEGLPDVGNFRAWARVVNARICLLLASEPNTLSAPMTNYVNCRGQLVVPAANDRRLYRQVNVVVSARNKAPPCANTVQVATPGGPTRQDLCPQPTP